jgi:plastocyanin
MSPTGRYAIAAIALAASMLQAEAETIRVSIDNLTFSPVEISAKVGDSVEWVNKDPFAHTATVKGQWDASIAPKKSAHIVLKQAGSFEYHCRFHPNMKGRVTVAAQ